MFQEFKTHINLNLNFLQKSRFLIAISGGIDSVVLAHLCNKLNLHFALAHCNFNLRSSESDADEAFVVQLGEELDVEVFTQEFNTEVYAKQHNLSIQMAARELRYNWFKDLRAQLDFDYVLTAHHADDNLETFLINFTRGTGLNGLTGIPEINDYVVRPLLQFSREQIEAYAKDNKISWREDSSNTSRKYLRNKLRHEVVPILKKINPQLLDSFQNTLNNLYDTADIVDESLNAVAKRAITHIDEHAITYKISEFKKVNNSKAYLFEMFKEYGFNEWNDVVHLLDAESGKYVSSNSHRLTKHREFLILSDSNSGHVILSPVEVSKKQVELGSLIKTPIGNLNFQIVTDSKFNTKTEIFIDTEQLIYPLHIRKWQQDDVFQPIGMIGKKKVSKYLKDEKLSPIEKENVFVVTTSNNTIIWVMGMRPDGRYKITDSTKQILKINYL